MKNYLIIGGTSGIGKSILKQLIQQGDYVINMSRTASEIASENHLIDVTKDVLPKIEVPLNGLIYCPGTILLKPFRSFKQEEILNDFSINVLGAVRVLQNYYNQLQKAAFASVLLFSTVAVQTGMPYHASIAMAKGAIEGLTKSLAAEWAPKIRVNCLALSLTDTPLATKLLDTDQKRTSSAERHPLKIIGDSNDIATIALMLLGEHTKFVSGQIWHLDGGISTIFKG